MGSSLATYTEIRNRTHGDISIGISSVDNYDWDGNSRPDHNLRGRTIWAGGSIREREEINIHANGNWYTLHIHRADGTCVSMRIDQGKLRYGGFEYASNSSSNYATSLNFAGPNRTLIIEDIAKFAPKPPTPPPIVSYDSEWIGWTQMKGEEIAESLDGGRLTTLPRSLDIGDIEPELRASIGNHFTVVVHFDIAPLLEKLSTLGVQTDRIIFIAHGFQNRGDELWIKDMKEAILGVENATVIVVAWGNGANIGSQNYPQAASNARVVGEWLGSCAKAIREKRGNNVKIWGIGHGLGAHLMGAAGRMSKSFDRITGLDPSGPLFEQNNQDIRLSKDDAEIVDVIHTDGWYSGSDYCGLNHFGTLIPLGTIDFYPNWGMEQPGTVHGLESHERAVQLFLTSIGKRGSFTTGSVLAKVPSFQSIAKETESCAQEVEMGFHYDKVSIPSPGSCYYFNTV